MRWLLLSSMALVLLAPVHALAEVTLETNLSTRRVEVSEQTQIKVTALGDAGEEISEPRLEVPEGVVVSGPSLGTHSQFSMGGGRMFRRSGLSATWAIAVSKPGTYRIGPPSVRADGRQVF